MELRNVDRYPMCDSCGREYAVDGASCGWARLCRRCADMGDRTIAALRAEGREQAARDREVRGF